MVKAVPAEHMSNLDKVHYLPLKQKQKEQKDNVTNLQASLKSQQKVAALYESSTAIDGTIAETYLKNHRNITSQLPESTRFIASAYEPITKTTMPAMAVFAKNSQGEIASAQLTYLNELTAAKADLAVAKRSYGKIKGSFVEIQTSDDPTKPLYIAEGIETALSIKEAKVPGQIIASLGISNIKNLDHLIAGQEGRQVVICADHDENGSPARVLIDKMALELKERGINVEVIRPKESGQDFNDVLKLEGDAGVAKYLPLLELNSVSPEVALPNPQSLTQRKENAIDHKKITWVCG
jgi:phage/plasmid primase-like uncharacterized protein